MTIPFSNSSPKIPKYSIFLSQIEAILFLHEIMHLDKFEGTDFNYDNNIFKFQFKKKKQIRHFSSQI